MCLLKLIDQDAGIIMIDGIDIASIPHEYLRSCLMSESSVGRRVDSTFGWCGS